MPNCVGAIDGKHILMDACGNNYSFTFVVVGAYGSQSDGGVFRNSKFGRMLESNEINLLRPICLPGSAQKFPSYFIGDTVFPL